MLCSVKISSINEMFNLALVRWYDYKSARKPDKYKCPLLILTSHMILYQLNQV